MKMIKTLFSILIFSLNLNLANAADVKDSASNAICKTCKSVEMISQIKLDNEKKLQSYENLINKSLIDQQKRLDDLWGVVSLLGYLAALLGVLTTIIVVFFSLRTSNSAISAAKEEANKSLDTWMRTNGEALLISEIGKTLSPKLESALQEIKDASTKILVELDNELKKTTKLNEELGNKSQNNDSNQSYTQSKENESEVQPEVSNKEPDTDLTTSNQDQSRPEEISDHKKIRKAQKLSRTNHIAEAITILESLIEKHENSTIESEIKLYIDASVALAKIEDKIGQPRKALSIYNGLVSKFSTSISENILTSLIPVINDQSYLYENMGNITEAINGYDKAIKLYDEIKPKGRLDLIRYTRAYNGKSRCIYNLKNYESTIDIYNEFNSKVDVSQLPLNSYDANLTIRTARSYLKLSKLAEAKNTLIDKIKLSKDVRSSSSTFRLKILLAQILDEDNKLDEALHIYDEIINYISNSDHLYSAYLMESLLEKAAIMSKKMVVFEELKIYEQIEDLWAKSGDEKEGLSVYAATAMVNRAITLSKIGDSTNALAVAKKAIENFHISLDHRVIEQLTKAEKLKALIER